MEMLNECESCKNYKLSLVDACKVGEVVSSGCFDFYSESCPLFDEENNENKLTERLVSKLLWWNWRGKETEGLCHRFKKDF